MKETYREYKEHVKELLQNKIYIFCIIVVAILAYGFTITNFSIGVDDLCFDRYVTGTYLLSAGRWGTTTLYTILHIFEFTPFWLEMVVTILTVIMGILFTIFIKKNVKFEFKTIHYIIFTSILISYPLLHQSFIYQSTNLSVIVCNLACMIIPMFIYETYKGKIDSKIYLTIAIIMPFFISMYESCCQTYICTMLIISFIYLLNEKINDKKTIKNMFRYIAIATLILFIGIVLNLLIVKGIKALLENLEILRPDFSSKSIPWLKMNGDALKTIVEKNIFLKLCEDFKNIPHIRNFIILAIICLVITIYKAIKQKKFMLIPIIIGIILSNFIINLLQIRILYRIDTSWCITIAFFAVFIFINIKGKTINNILCAIFCIIILLQTKQMNQYFYNDYIRYKKEENYMADIANEIVRTCKDITKPIVYLYNVNTDTKELRCNEDNGWSVINWGANGFTEPGFEITKFMNSLGYKFTPATRAETLDAMGSFDNLVISMPGYERIQETEKYIIVVVDYNV